MATPASDSAVRREARQKLRLLFEKARSLDSTVRIAAQCEIEELIETADESLAREYAKVATSLVIQGYATKTQETELIRELIPYMGDKVAGDKSAIQAQGDLKVPGGSVGIDKPLVKTIEVKDGK